MRVTSRAIGLFGVVTVAATVISGCGGTSATLTSSNGSQDAAGSQPQDRAPGANGKIAEVSGSTLQVQGRASQTTVTVNDATTIRQDQAVGLASAKAGECVFATGSYESGVLAAMRVQISEAVDGSCQNAPGMGAPGTGGGGRPGGGMPPSGMPTDMPSAPPGGTSAAGSMTMATGKVSAAGSDEISIDGRVMSLGKGASSNDAAQPESIKIRMAASGQALRQVKAARSALVVGQCATATGPADAKGAIVATAITVSAPVAGECMMMGRGGAGRPAGASGGGASGA